MWHLPNFCSDKLFKIILFCCCLSITISSDAKQQFKSLANKTQLIELYTSEGCSSCPPADRWLSTFTSSPDLWRSIIPIAFHVDYWDYIGWPDRFASPKFAQRQRQHKRFNNSRAIYTPGFIVDGKEWKGWWANQAPPQLSEKVGILSISMNGKSFEADFLKAKDLVAKQLSIAILGFGLETNVSAGENRGEKLQHDFVVLAMKHYSGSTMWQGELPVVRKAQDTKRLGFVAWVSNDLVPVQAVGGWID